MYLNLTFSADTYQKKALPIPHTVRVFNWKDYVKEDQMVRERREELEEWGAEKLQEGKWRDDKMHSDPLLIRRRHSKTDLWKIFKKKIDTEVNFISQKMICFLVQY